jgi:pimeloyl-ACP methyl ester carboxylesterase
MAKFDLVHIASEDETLHGLATQHGDDGLVVHLHGSWGNFYENAIATDLTDAYSSYGFRFAAVNDRGHDYGTVHEDLDVSLSDLPRWIDYLAPKGPIILQAHSLGALKAMRFLTSDKYSRWTNRVVAAILLSPFDVAAFYGGKDDGVIEASRERVNRKIDANRNDLVDKDVFDIWPISSRTFLRATEIGGPWDIFPTRNGSTGVLRSVNCPVLSILGSEDFAATPSIEAVARTLENDGLASIVVDGAPHNFAGFEGEVNSAIAKFLDKALRK